MRVKCPYCGERHDISIRDVLAEADRLRALRSGRPVAVSDPSAPEVDGNTLTPAEIEQRRRREIHSEE